MSENNITNASFEKVGGRKNHKYILRWMENGTWHYVYDDIDPKNKNNTKKALNNFYDNYVKSNRSEARRLAYERDHNPDADPEQYNRYIRTLNAKADDGIESSVNVNKAYDQAYSKTLPGMIEKGKNFIEKIFKKLNNKRRKSK